MSLFIGCSGSTQCPAEASSLDSAESLTGLWIGGFGPTGGAGAYLRIDFSAGTVRLNPNLHRAPLGIIHPKLVGDTLGFAVDDGQHRRSFEFKRTSADSFEGKMSDATAATPVSVPTRLVALQSDEPAAIDAFAGGTYAIDGDPHQLLFVQDGTLFDSRDGSIRRLFLRRTSAAIVGPGVATSYPTQGTITITPLALTWERANTAPLFAPRFALTSEEVRFESAAVMLRGTLLSPPNPGPHPAVVYVHGSGRSTRKDAWPSGMARVFLSEGYSVLLYDKRGVGDSGGEYVGRGARDQNNVSPDNLARLASDVRAAAAFLGSRSDIDSQRIGLLGLSQAGWIAPLAAAKSKSIRFLILLSAPAVHTPDVGHEHQVVRRDTEDESFTSSGFSPQTLATLRAWLKTKILPK